MFKDRFLLQWITWGSFETKVIFFERLIILKNFKKCLPVELPHKKIVYGSFVLANNDLVKGRRRRGNAREHVR